MGGDLGSCCMGLVSVAVATTVWGVSNQLLHGGDFLKLVSLPGGRSALEILGHYCHLSTAGSKPGSD
jgi:hypothetical protein